MLVFELGIVDVDTFGWSGTGLLLSVCNFAVQD